MAKKLDFEDKGRKSYQKRRKVRLSIAVPESIEKELREAAEEFEVSISAIITEVLKKHKGKLKHIAHRIAEEL